jgi:hypothetical protein
VNGQDRPSVVHKSSVRMLYGCGVYMMYMRVTHAIIMRTIKHDSPVFGEEGEVFWNRTDL